MINTILIHPINANHWLQLAHSINITTRPPICVNINPQYVQSNNITTKLFMNAV